MILYFTRSVVSLSSEYLHENKLYLPIYNLLTMRMLEAMSYYGLF